MKQQKKVSDTRVSRRNFLTRGAGTMFAMNHLHGITLDAAPIETVFSKTFPAKTYVCPPCGLPCDKLTYDKPGDCPSCGMKLVPVGPAEAQLLQLITKEQGRPVVSQQVACRFVPLVGAEGYPA